MTCSEYVASYSEVHDGIASGEVIRAADEHLAACASCRRYRHVLERGSALLRSLPAPEVHDDFTPRLQHRLYHVDQDEVLRRHTGSGTTALAVLGMAVLLVAVAWAPALRPSAPEVALAPIVVDSPPPGARARSLASFTAFASFSGFASFAAAAPRTSSSRLSAPLWGDARSVLFEYSRLAQRYGQRSTFGRAGLQQEQ